MAIFAIIGQPGQNTARLPQAIQQAFPNDYISLKPDAWFVAFNGSAQDLSNKLGITDGSNGSAIVASISTYYGRANPDIWSWVKNKWEATSG